MRFPFSALLFIALLATIALTNAGEAKNDVDRLRQHTKIVREKKMKFAQSIAETKARIKAFAAEQYASLEKQEKMLRKSEKDLMAELKNVVKKRRLDMDKIVHFGKEKKMRRLQMEKTMETTNIEDIRMQENQANSRNTSLVPRNRQLFGPIGDAASSFGNAIGDAASSVGNAIGDAASSAWDAASDFADDLVGAAKEAWDYMDKITSIIENSLGSLWEFVKNIINNVRFRRNAKLKIVFFPARDSPYTPS
jgi:hypothetical protein